MEFLTLKKLDVNPGNDYILFFFPRFFKILNYQATVFVAAHHIEEYALNVTEKLTTRFTSMVTDFIPTTITIRLLTIHSSILTIMLQTIPTFSYSRENPPAKMIDFRQSVIEQATELASIPEVTDLQPDSDLEMNMLLPRIV